MPKSPPPLLRAKRHAEPSVFRPESLLREARRQKGLPAARVPTVCLLDPDGDIARTLRAERRAQRDPTWACYHTDLYRFRLGRRAAGVIACAVGGSFAVLLAEELFASGCELLISVTSAGQIVAKGRPPYFILIEKALRDEGTSYHYLPPSRYSELSPRLRGRLSTALARSSPPVIEGAVWTTDAPFRETETAIAAARREGLLAVEMEAASLYAFARARRKPVVCFAHVTNRLGVEGDFEKGAANGAHDALALVETVAKALA